MMDALTLDMLKRCFSKEHPGKSIHFGARRETREKADESIRILKEAAVSLGLKCGEPEYYLMGKPYEGEYTYKVKVTK